MLKYFFNLLIRLNITGLFVTIFIEGLAIPFPGTPILLTYGYLLDLNLIEILKYAVLMSLFYLLASLIPYGIAYKLEEKMEKYFKAKIIKAQDWFEKYGEISIAIARPFGFGNYISYVAGLSKIKILKYLMLTFLGIFPWNFFVLFLGSYYQGNIESIIALIEKYQKYVLLILFIIAISYFFLMFKKKKKKEG